MKNGEVYSWGNNEHGQCGTGKEPFQQMIQWGPQMVKFDSYHSPMISQINTGAAHSAFVDEIGRLFLCGRGESGQLGNMSYNDETLPYFVQKIPDKVLEVACGEDHSVVVTKSQGEVYVMGSNQRGQLGIGGPSRGSNVPVLLAELSFTKIVKVRAGAFSAGLSMDQ
jgi:Regulator of chromosome condensation (RCC1) repeat